MSSVCEFTLDIRWGRTMTYRPEDKSAAYLLGMDGDRLRIVNSTYFQVLRLCILYFLFTGENFGSEFQEYKNVIDIYKKRKENKRNK